MKIQTPFVFQKIMDAGSSHPFIARVSSGIPDLLNGTVFSKQQRESLTSLCFYISKALVDAEAESLPVIKNIEEIERNLQQTEQNNPNHTLSEIPSVKSLRNIKAFFHFGKEALRHLFAGLGIILGKDFKEAAYLTIKKFIEKLPDSEKFEPLVEVLNLYEPYIDKFIKRRNQGIEHWDPLKPSYIMDYSIENKNGHCVLKRPSFNDGVLILSYLKDTLKFLFRYIEDILVIAISIYLKPYIVIREIPQEKRDPINPKRYRLDLLGNM